LPTPRYPEEAKRLKIAGRVTVRVVVDENGKVVSAAATEGPAALRQSAEDAARAATFKPKVAGGITVKMTGVLTFDFKLP
jgi:TonB family protein